jgi:geranylgeranyl transferase type-2 subunit beta
MLENRRDCLGDEMAIDKPSLKNRLFQFLSPTGGFSRHAGELRVSAYDTFLGGLCLQMLGEEFPRIEDAVRAVEALKQPDGGYAEIAGQPASQTAATAAATAFLTMHEAIAPERSAETVDFLFSLQSDDGGLKPHGSVETGDLLSTFTGLVALAAFDALGRLDAGRLANFLRQTAIPTGGFLACPNDAEADLEYTYYGIGVLAMLRTLGH